MAVKGGPVVTCGVARARATMVSIPLDQHGVLFFFLERYGGLSGNRCASLVRFKSRSTVRVGREFNSSLMQCAALVVLSATVGPVCDVQTRSMFSRGRPTMVEWQSRGPEVLEYKLCRLPPAVRAAAAAAVLACRTRLREAD